uniref:Radial spoke head 3 n=1 Tax=Cairina moschata TaxID=8855 RepID=A0A8C3CGB5_CAIMO
INETPRRVRRAFSAALQAAGTPTTPVRSSRLPPPGTAGPARPPPPAHPATSRPLKQLAHRQRTRSAARRFSSAVPKPALKPRNLSHFRGPPAALRPLGAARGRCLGDGCGGARPEAGGCPPCCPPRAGGLRPRPPSPTATAARPAPCPPAPSTGRRPRPPRSECQRAARPLPAGSRGLSASRSPPGSQGCASVTAGVVLLSSLQGEGARPLCQPHVRPEGGARQHVRPAGHPRELYLEEISDRTIEVDMECQTDAFLDRPPTPFFIPAKTGRDVATQIEEGELFDFDVEVEPILEVLVGKTMEQALLEVMEEEELAQLWAHQRAYAELRNAELAEVQRLEEQDRRYREEKERRKLQHMQMLQKQKETTEKIAAWAFAKRYLTDLIPSVFINLRESGFFYDPIERDIETEFLPWLMTEVEETLEKKVLGRMMLDCKLPNPGI